MATEELPALDWVKIRAGKYAGYATPDDWPKYVKPVSNYGLTLLGIDTRNGDLHWDGHKIETTKRLATFERVLAVVATVATALVALIELARFCIERSA